MFRNTYILLHIFIYEVDCENVDKNFVIRKIYISLYTGTYIYLYVNLCLRGQYYSLLEYCLSDAEGIQYIVY